MRNWVHKYLNAEARARAGDSGEVVLRRLSNAEYENTVCDLTGVYLEPAFEFPADSVAGEGFANKGQSLFMSPALLSKYLDAANQIAARAVLLPDGLRFSGPGSGSHAMARSIGSGRRCDGLRCSLLTGLADAVRQARSLSRCGNSW